ncbi:MAG: DUF5671 domain-containing protein [Patescibacteria group bacterium]
MNYFPLSLMMSFILIIPVILIIAIVLASREENNNMNKQNAKYAFYYLLSFVALVFMALSVGMVFFEIINKSVFDAIDNSGFSSGVLQFAISALIIATPIYYLISNLIAKGLRKQELDKDSGIRRWLTYFIILVSSLIILGVLIAAITNFLNGELTTRFILKSLVAVIIAAATFSFYFYDIKREDLVKKDKVVKIFFFASLALVLVAFILAWFFVDSPKVMRDRRLDQIVLNNISNIENAVNSYYDKNKKLPDSLEVLKNNSDFYLNEKTLQDPENGTAINYNKKSATEFEFCATFRTNSKELNDQNGNYYNIPSSQVHLAGYQCLKGNLYVLNNNSVKGIDINRPAEPAPAIPVTK